MEYNKNKSSDFAKIFKSIEEIIKIEIWYDKHYFLRLQFGDDLGKREGIDFDIVQDLVINAIKHMIFYSACVKNFAFINHNVIEKNIRAFRIVCQKQIKTGMLNVVIEAHSDEINKYEITIKTAMCTNDFKIADGQYVIEILDNERSILRLMARNKLTEVYYI